jgi:hypothetical protein
MTINVACARCGRLPRAAEEPEMVGAPPRGWEGTVLEAFCPGCQLGTWHPECTSLVDLDGARVDPATIPEQVWGPGSVEVCGYVDRAVSWVDDGLEGAGAPTSWVCPNCGGTQYIGVHGD